MEHADHVGVHFMMADGVSNTFFYLVFLQAHVERGKFARWIL